MLKYKDRLYSLVEYVIASMFIHGGIKTFFFSDASVLPGIFKILVGQFAVYFYGLFFFVLGVALFYSKIRKRERLHKHTLMVMYLTCVYIFFLAAAVNGVDGGLITTVVVGGATGYLWLREKIATEYISVKEFRETL